MVQIFGIRTVCLRTSQKTQHELTDLLVLATQAIANVVKSSFGPSGLDKMMVDDIGVSEGCCVYRAIAKNIGRNRDE